MSDSYTQGSEGSRICSSNIRKYPLAETKPLDEYSPSETDHKLEANECTFKAPTASESIRRTNNRVRDRKRRWAIETGPLAVEDNSKALQVANEHVKKLDK